MVFGSKGTKYLQNLVPFHPLVNTLTQLPRMSRMPMKANGLMNWRKSFTCWRSWMKGLLVLRAMCSHAFLSKKKRPWQLWVQVRLLRSQLLEMHQIQRKAVKMMSQKLMRQWFLWMKVVPTQLARPLCIWRTRLVTPRPTSFFYERATTFKELYDMFFHQDRCGNWHNVPWVLLTKVQAYIVLSQVCKAFVSTSLCYEDTSNSGIGPS